MSKRYELFPHEKSGGELTCKRCLAPIYMIDSADSRTGRLGIDVRSRQVEGDGRETFAAHFTVCEVPITPPTPQQKRYKKRAWFPRQYESEPAPRKQA